MRFFDKTVAPSIRLGTASLVHTGLMMVVVTCTCYLTQLTNKYLEDAWATCDCRYVTSAIATDSEHGDFLVETDLKVSARLMLTDGGVCSLE